MKRVLTNMGASALGLALVVVSVPAQDRDQQNSQNWSQFRDRDKNATDRAIGTDAGQARIRREVRHELVMLPYYGVFDNLGYRVDGDTVGLSGQVTRPALREDAENVVKGIEGVTRVENRIEVLPLSPMDDGIRKAMYHCIFGKPGLDRYAMQAVPPIHIIVANGKVTLEGVVATVGDRNQAGIYANTVSGVFSVTNNLRVENDRK